MFNNFFTYAQTRDLFINNNIDKNQTDYIISENFHEK